MVEDDYTFLVRTGAPSAAEIAQAWMNIYSEYCELIGGTDIAAMIRLIRQLNSLDSKITRVQGAIALLRQVYLEDTAAVLQSLGYAVSHDPVNPSILARSLTIIEARLNPEILKRKQLELELVRDKSADDKPAKMTEESFTMTIIEIEKHEGHTIREDITVYKYCLYVKRLQKHIESLTKINKNGRQ